MDHQDRRRSYRYPSVVPGGVLCWESGGVPVEEPVRVVNVSLDGCLLECRRGPGNIPGLQLLLKCPGISFPDGIEGVLVGARHTIFRSRPVRMRFLNPLPFVSFKILVYGPDQEVPTPNVQEHEWDIYWR
jgi:hypothetical protein